MESKWKLYLKKIGWAGFFFFLIKGLVWVAIFLGAGKLFSQSNIELSGNFTETIFLSAESTDFQKVDGSKWDLAFEVNAQGAGVRTNAAQGVKIYKLQNQFVSKWPAISIQDTLGSKLAVNSVLNWVQGSANFGAQPPFNFGWGAYDLTTHQVSGNSVFYIESTEGNGYFIRILNIDKTVWNIEFIDNQGNLSGTSIDKAQSTSLFQYYDIDSGEEISIEPEKWDIQITKSEVTNQWAIYTHPLAKAGYSETCELGDQLNTMGKVQSKWLVGEGAEIAVSDSNSICFGRNKIEKLDIISVSNTHIQFRIGKANAILQAKAEQKSMQFQIGTNWIFDSVEVYDLMGRKVGELHQNSTIHFPKSWYLVGGSKDLNRIYIY